MLKRIISAAIVLVFMFTIIVFAKTTDSSNLVEQEVTIDTRNSDSISDKELLIVSFGTTDISKFDDISYIEDYLTKQHPEYSLRRCFLDEYSVATLRTEGIIIDSLDEALERASVNGVKTIIIQPLLFFNDSKYSNMIDIIADHYKQFDNLAIGQPILASNNDLEKLTNLLKPYNVDDSKLVILYDEYTTNISKLQHLDQDIYYVYDSDTAKVFLENSNFIIQELNFYNNTYINRYAVNYTQLNPINLSHSDIILEILSSHITYAEGTLR